MRCRGKHTSTGPIRARFAHVGQDGGLNRLKRRVYARLGLAREAAARAELLGVIAGVAGRAEGDLSAGRSLERT